MAIGLMMNSNLARRFYRKCYFLRLQSSPKMPTPIRAMVEGSGIGPGC